MANNIETEYQESREAVKNYYADLLILQYRQKKKARETIKLCADIYLADGLVFQLPDILDIDTAQGAQLDIIGKILDCPRTVQGLDVDKKYFAFANNPDGIGFSRVNAVKKGIFKNIYDSSLSLYSLVDRDYKALLRLKSIVNVQRASMQQMDDILYNNFGENIILKNNQNLTINYVISSNLIIPLMAALNLGYFRAPAGVGFGIIINVPHPRRIYGFARINSQRNAIGFSRAGEPNQATFLTRKNILNKTL